MPPDPPDTLAPAPMRLYRPTGPDRVAVVSTEPASRGWLVRLAVGRGGGGALSGGTAFGPFGRDELADRFAEAVAGLRADGFVTPGLPALLDALGDPSPRRRARAALRLGWRREAAAVGPLLQSLPDAVDEICSYLDALGAIGDPAAIPALREYAGRKLLSRRRSAVEALRSLGDVDGLADAEARARDQLPPPVREALDAGGGPAAVAAAVLGLDGPFRGLAADLLYEIGSPVAREAALRALDGLAIDQPYAWRYAKSVFKRSMLRHDPEAFGRIARRIEATARGSAGSEATLRSGYDGVERPTPVFRRPTQGHARRLGWRYLANLARHRPDLYPHAAAEAVAAYTPDDPDEPRGLRGAFARCYLWQRVLFGRSQRFRLDGRRLVFRFRDSASAKAPAGVREEAYPDLWDAWPSAYLRILAGAKLTEAHDFALRAIADRHPRLIEGADVDRLVAMLAAPSPVTVALANAELSRRFDPARPDLPLLDRLLSSEAPRARELGRDWLRASAPAWTRDQEWVLVFATFPDAETAALAGELSATALRDQPALRRALAPRVLDRLRAPETSPGAHDVLARLAADALAVETAALLGLPELLALCRSGSPPLQALGGRLIAARPEVGAVLDMDGLRELAEHEVAAVRAAGQGLLDARADDFRADPSTLFLLIESDWPDTRAAAFAVLRDRIGFDAIGFEGVVGLLDSNREDVREAGRAFALAHADRIDPRLLAARMVEHPAPDMRRFALDLAVVHLPDGADALAGLDWFFRATLLELAPDRLLKRRVIDFLQVRGRRDPHQAEVAARLLGEFARIATRSDAEHALEAIARIHLAWPEARLPEGVVVGAGGVP